MKEMHLRQARILKTDEIFVDGEISISDDVWGGCACPPHRELCLSRSFGSDHLSVRVDHSKREAETGFMTSELYGDIGVFQKDGLQLVFPTPFSDCIQRALSWAENANHKVAMTTNMPASLEVNRVKRKQIYYHLENCYLEISQENKSIKVKFTGDGIINERSYSDLEDEIDQPDFSSVTNRVECSFLVDYVSRAVRYGVQPKPYTQISKSSRQRLELVESVVPVPTLQQLAENSLSIEHAYINEQPSILYGIQDGRWVSIEDSGKQQLHIWPLNELIASDTGFVVTRGSSGVPSLRIDLWGIEELLHKMSINSVRGKMPLAEKVFTFDFPVGEWVPTSMQSREDYDSRIPVDRQIKRLKLHLWLNETGLFISLRAFCPTYEPREGGLTAKDGWIEGEILVPLASLVARYPKFWLAHRMSWMDARRPTKT